MITVDEVRESDELIECCNLCGSAGVAHFEENTGPTNTIHRCLRCLAEYTTCNFGPGNVDMRARLTGTQSSRRSK